MKKFVVFLCLGILGCSTVHKTAKITPVVPGSLAAAVKQESAAEAEITATPKPVPVNPQELETVIAVFTEAINKNPGYAGAYYNRARAYFFQQNYDKSWQDVHQAQSFGYKFNSAFLESLRKASGREQ